MVSGKNSFKLNKEHLNIILVKIPEACKYYYIEKIILIYSLK